MSIQELADQLRSTAKVLVFTGAGISTGSGIPDFRGPQGLWKKWRPVYYQEFMSSEEARVRHWQYKLESWRAFRDARPNAAHLALAELDRAGHLDTLVTQNIDGLHHLAGHDPGKIIELHGTNRLVECQSCQSTQDPDPVFKAFEASGQAPLCECGGYLKPATISFGQLMPEDKLRNAFAAAQRAEIVMSVGSTLEVEPAASVPRLAKESGAFYVVINQGQTMHDFIADLRIEGDVNVVLKEAVRVMRG